MPKSRYTMPLVLILFSITLGAFLSLIFSRFTNFNPSAQVQTNLPSVALTASSLTYAPPKLDQAPANMKEAVLLGYNIVHDTSKYAGAYVGNKLSCTNCHFNAGQSQGGKNGGISLVGVGATYPAYKSRQKYSVDLVARTEDCFERSMNGKALPATGKEMESILAYYQWLSKDIPVYSKVPWLGLPVLKSTHVPDAQAGGQLFGQQCTSCHGAEGQGTAAAPPVFGPDSFNDGAGMAKVETLASFALNNMPKGNPDLTEEQALDVAAFVDSQPRPHIPK
ncbi:MAG: c-type cytochrome [Desulfitobacteriaceae bacterium]